MTLAAGAFLGWGTLLVRHFWFFKPTPFFISNENLQQDVIAIFHELGEPAFTDAPGTTMRSEGSSAVQRTMVFRIPLPPEQRAAFLRAMQKRVREKLSQAGCHARGEASGSGTIGSDAVLGYTFGTVSGTFQICVMDADDQHAAVVVTTEEQRGRGLDLGLEMRH